MKIPDIKHIIASYPERLALFLNGVLYFDKGDRTERVAASLVMECILLNGGNILIFPESTLNRMGGLIVLPITG